MSQVWFITGSSVGLGRAIVEAALTAGHRVVATARSEAALADLATQHPEQLLVTSLNVASESAWSAAIDTAMGRFGRIDVLVNNAGYGGLGSAEDIPMSLVRDQFETNFFGAVLAARAVIPAMRAQGGGRILLISSIGSRIATAGTSAYYASKAAVSAFAESLALEVGPLGIKVTAIEPGAMRTRFAEAGSMKIAPFDHAYDATVGATVAMLRTPEYQAALRDPAGHAAVVLAAADLDDPPTRLLAGADSYDYGAAALTARAEADQHWSALSRIA